MARDPLKGIMKGESHVRVVAHSPRRRLLVSLAVALVCAAGAAGGYYLGESKAGLDAGYLSALERMDRANEIEIAQLRSRLIDANLARSVESEAARELRDDIRLLRDEVAGLEEEADDRVVTHRTRAVQRANPIRVGRLRHVGAGP